MYYSFRFKEIIDRLINKFSPTVYCPFFNSDIELCLNLSDEVNDSLTSVTFLKEKSDPGVSSF